MALRDRFPSGGKCYSQRLSETYNFMLVRSEARVAELREEEENMLRQFRSQEKRTIREAQTSRYDYRGYAVHSNTRGPGRAHT